MQVSIRFNGEHYIVAHSDMTRDGYYIGLNEALAAAGKALEMAERNRRIDEDRV